MKNKLILIGLLFGLLSACVTSRTVTENQIGDTKLTCIELAARYGELNALKALAEKEHEGIGGNSMYTLGNSSVGGQNVDSINKRKAILAGYYDGKSCNAPIPQYSIEEIKNKIESGDVKELNG